MAVFWFDYSIRSVVSSWKARCIRRARHLLKERRTSAPILCVNGPDDEATIWLILLRLLCRVPYVAFLLFYAIMKYSLYMFVFAFVVCAGINVVESEVLTLRHGRFIRPGTADLFQFVLLLLMGQSSPLS